MDFASSDEGQHRGSRVNDAGASGHSLSNRRAADPGDAKSIAGMI
jgi:hypothetical protein